MGEPRDIDRAPLSPAAARRVLVALDADDDAGSGGGRGFPAIAGYTIERELGRGAGGVTYLAHKAGSEAKIALKVLHARAGNGASQRAWRELDTLQQARAPSVPRLLDFGTTDHSMYIATEYIEGTPLSELYENERPADLGEMRERVRLLEKLARAAHSLHERGVIHRDLKPSNVIVAPAGAAGPGDRAGAAAREVGEPFILDLGIALIDTPDLHGTLTQEGQPVGTPAFMAPEQARGKREEISTRSDIYSLGAIGYWLCTGETPHDLAGATLHEAIRRVGSEAGRDPRSIGTGLPRPLGAVLSKACDPRAGGRYSSAESLAEDAKRWLSGDPVEASAPARWRRAMRWIERRPVFASAVLGVLIIGSSIAVSFGAVWHLNQRPANIIKDTSGSARWARVTTATGRTVRAWRSSAPGGLHLAEMFDAGADVQPRDRIATVVQNAEGLPANLDSELCVWDGRNPSRLLWATAGLSHKLSAPRYSLPPATSRDLLESPEAYPQTGTVVFSEVFEESPGREIITVRRHIGFDPSVVLVHGADGEILFEAWHWGAIGDIVWVPSERIIVIRALNNEWPLSDLGLQGASTRWPIVLFAIDPQYGVRRGWVNPRLARSGEEALWYRCLLPLEVGDLHENLQLDLLIEPYRPAVVRFEIAARGFPSARMYFDVDALGNVVFQGRTDSWRQADHPLTVLTPTLADLPDPVAGHR